jgi:hypothetical protein
MKIPKDTRDKFWQKIELAVQKTSKDKDPKANLLPTKYKKFLRVQDGFKVYAVDGNWIYNNLSVIFGHGGHEYVHEFIPRGEIWFATTHHHCKCKVKPNAPISQGYFDSGILHEITECKEMAKGTKYWAAHNIALEAERRAKYKFDDGEIL